MQSLILPRPPKSPPFQTRPIYTLSDFSDYHDIDFMRNAYRGILNREPDPNGLHHYLTRLRAGTSSKIEILGGLRYSAEGRKHKVKIRFLLPLFLLQLLGRIPVFGYFVLLAEGLLKLPYTIRNLRGLDGYINCQFSQWQQLSNEQSTLVEQAFQSRDTDLSDWRNKHYSDYESLSQQVRDLEHYNQELSDRQQQLQNHNQELSDRQQQLQNHNQELSDRQQQLQNHNQELSEKYQYTHEKYEKLQILHQDLQTQYELLRPSFDKRINRLKQLIQQTEDAKADRGQVGELVQRVNRVATEFIQRIEQIEKVQIDPAEYHQNKEKLAEIRLQLIDHRRDVLDQQRRIIVLLEDTYNRVIQPSVPVSSSNEYDHILDSLYVSFEDRFRGTREQVKAGQKIYLPYLMEIEAGSTISPILDVGCGRGEWLELLHEQKLTARGLDLNRVMVHECHAHGLDVLEDNAIDYLRRQPANSLGAVTGFHIVEHLPFMQLVALFDETLRALKPGGIAIFETPNPENMIVSSYTFYFDVSHRNPLPPPTLQYLAEARGFIHVDILRLHPREETGMDDALLDKWFRNATDYAVVCRK